MTEFIIGKACADVTGGLYRKLLKSAEKGRAIIIVPDQFEFETEKALYRACRKTGLTKIFPNISVRTFSGLSSEIVSKYSSGKQPAGDITKIVLMYRAAKDMEKDLSVFGRNASKSGFAAKMVETVAMFKTAGYSDTKLAEIISKKGAVAENAVLFAKLSDISSLYSEYDGLLSGNYTDVLDMTSAAAKLLKKHNFFKEADAFVDGFNSFSASQLYFLQSVIENADNVTFAFTSDGNEGCRDIFESLNKDISRLAEYSEESVGQDRTIEINERFTKSGSLLALSEEIFSKNDKPNLSVSGGIRIIRADDVYAEMDFVAAEIKRLVTEENQRYNSIAVLAADTSEYRTPIESAFEKYGIPIFGDIPESILYMPLVNLILSLLRVLCEFTSENVLSYVKTGFLRDEQGRELSFKDTDSFEDYIYRWNVRGKELAEEFNTDGIGKIYAERAKQAERIRKLAVPPVMGLREKIRNEKKPDGSFISEQICGFLLDTLKIEKIITEKCNIANDKELSQNYQTLWNTIVEIFDALYEGLSGVEITIREYYELFRDICSYTTLAKPPQVLDAVLVGDIERTRAEGINTVFIVGAVSGKFPGEHGGYGLFSEYEAELLCENDLKIALKREEVYCKSRYQAYRALTLAKERLYITYPILDTSCAVMKPSELADEITERFPNIKEEHAEDMDDVFYCRSKRAIRQRFASSFSEGGKRTATLAEALDKTGNGDFVKEIEKRVGARDTSYKHKLKPKTASKLFRNRRFSATGVESLGKCRFEYFCSKGLNIRERFKVNDNNRDVGNAVHYVLQKVLELYCGNMDEFLNLPKEELNSLAVRYLEEYKNLFLGGDYCKTLSFRYMYANLALGACDMLMLLQAEFKGREYRPVFFELGIGLSGVLSAVSPANKKLIINTPPLKILLSGGGSAEINGKLDRADMFTGKDDRKYIRVVDYKTGGKEFSIPNILNGINTQMLLYLLAICEANGELFPGGVSYLPSGITGAGKKEFGLFRLLAGDHKQSGMYVRTEEAEREMNMYAEFISKMTVSAENPRSFIKPDTLKPPKENSLVPEHYMILKEECLNKITEILNALYNGDVSAVPVIYTENNRERKKCDYCRFSLICGNNGKHEIRTDNSKTIAGETEDEDDG